MAQTGYTPISLYYSTAASAAPTAGNLVAGELAINTNDGILYYKDSSGVVQKLATKGGVGTSSTTQVLYNNAGLIAGSANFTFNGTTVTIANDASISGLTVGKGGGSVASNTVVGLGALSSNTTGLQNTIVGYQSGSTATGSYFTAVGYLAGFKTTDSSYGNSFIGRYAGYNNTTGGNNTVCGGSGLTTNTTGSYNTALGVETLYSNTTGANNTAVGFDSLYNNTTASNNVAVGYQALYSNTTGQSSCAVGTYALYSNTTGSDNTAIGNYETLYSNTTGTANIAVGRQALRSNTTASNSVAVGYQAGYSNQTGAYNCFMGGQAGYTATGGYNTCIGGDSGGNFTTGTFNTFVGYGSGGSITTGGKNTIIGRYSGNAGGLDIRTASNNVVLSDGDGNPRLWINSSGTLQSYANVNGDVAMYMTNLANSTPFGLQMTFQNAAPNNSSQFFFLGVDSSANRFVAMSNGGLKNYQANNVNLSDEREKKDIELAGNYLDKLCQVPVKTFLYNDQTDTELNVGIIAQDLQAICPELVTETNWATKDEPEKMRLSVYETDLKYAMLKAIQELKAEVDSLKQQLGK